MWVDLSAATPEEFDRVFGKLVGVHALTREDLTEVTPRGGAHLPKIEEFPDYLLVIVNPLPPRCADADPRHDPGYDRLDRPQLGAVLTANVLVTAHAGGLACVRQARKLLDRNQAAMRRGPDYVFHLILDAMVDEYGPVLDAVADELDAVERSLFGRPHPRVLSRLLHLKRQVSFMRKTLALEREVLAKLTRGDFDLVDEREMAYYRDVHDHLVRYAEMADAARETVGDLVQTHLALSSHRLNGVIKILTMISTAILPMTLVSGIYGMNFKHMPELDWRYGYALALGLMAAIGVGTVVLFRVKKWL